MLGPPLPDLKEPARIRELPPRMLRVAMIVGARQVLENWQLMLIDRIIGDPVLEFAGVLKTEEASIRPRSGRVFAAFAALEKALLARQRSYVPKTGMRTLDVAETAGDEIAETLEALQVDVALNCTPERLPDDASRRTAFGEWWFNFSDERDSRADWYGYDAAVHGKPLVDLVLMARNGRAQHRISSASFNAKPSGARNGAAVKERAVTLLLRELRRVAKTGTYAIELASLPEPSDPPRGPRLLGYGASLATGVAKRLRKLVPIGKGGQSAVWTLFTGSGDIGHFDPSSAVEIRPGAKGIKADPFLFSNDGETYLFYEAYDQGDSKAHIAAARFEGDGIVELGPVLERPYHLSYPLVFRDGDQIFMLPETHEAEQIEIWRCTDFPMKWELHSTAFKGRSAADSVLTRFDDKWWLFTNLSNHHAFEDHCSELHVFQVDGPDLREITPHNFNPVVMGSTHARNGGRIFNVDGRLLRPAQRNENGIYGYGLAIMQITKLTLDEYSERCVRTIDPDFHPDIFGCHHFDADGGRYIVDARLAK